jgi:hypothetical protein
MNLQEVRDMVLTNLKEVVKRDDQFMPVAFFDGPQTAIVGCPFSDDTKIPTLRKVGSMARQMHAIEVYMVMDAYMRVLEDKKEAKWVVDNWEIERPSMYPEKLRKDCLVITKITPGDPKAEDCLVIIYEKKNGEVSVTSEDIMDSFDGLVKESILEGYNDEKETHQIRPGYDTV